MYKKFRLDLMKSSLKIQKLTFRNCIQGLIVNSENTKVLLIKKFDNALKKYYWRLPKGTIEKGENEIIALRREMREELGLKNLRIVSKICKYKFKFKQEIVNVSVFLIRVPKKIKIILEKKEKIEKSAWFDFKSVIGKLKWPEERNAIRNYIKTIKNSNL
jgi:8-oxo-dGTP pyrophosphatase MutT (NUDIX family)